jgi:glycosyltransferase involved in cell wall biosynthesis
MPFYWLLICLLLLSNKQRDKNFILLESVVELNFSIPVLFSKILGYKIVHDVVENFFIEQKKITKSQKTNLFISRLFYIYTSFYSNGIIVISEELFKMYSEYNKPIIKIYNAIEINKIDVSCTVKNTATTFLYSGTFGSKDGVKDLILAFNKISVYYSNIKLVLTGKNNSKYFQECMDLIKSNEKIKYLGYLSYQDLDKEYQNADVLVITRDNSLFANYGFPYKLSEYLTYKKPVICSAVSDIPALFTDYVDILLTQPSNIESIIEKMKYTIEHKSELIQLSENGFNKGKEYFSISKNGSLLNNFLVNI